MMTEETTPPAPAMSAAELTEHLRRELLLAPSPERIAAALQLGHDTLDQLSDIDDRLSIAHVLTQHYVNAGAFAEAHAVADRAVAIANGDPRRRSRALYQRATILHRERRLDDAMEILEQLYLDVRPDEQPQLRARILNLKASIRDVTGDAGRAEELYSESYLLREQQNDLHGLAITAYNIAILHARRDDRHSAMQHFMKALELQRSLGETSNVADTLCHVAMLHALQNNANEAIATMNEAVELARSTGVPSSLAMILVNRASMYERLGDRATYRSAIQEALDVVQDMPFREIHMALRQQLASDLARNGELDEAERVIDETLVMARADRAIYVECHLLQLLGHIRSAQQRYDEAVDAMHLAIDHAHDLRMTRFALELGSELATVLRDAGRDAEAVDVLQRVIADQRDVAKTEFDARINEINRRFDRERRIREAEIERLRNVELSSANARLQQMNDDLRALAEDKDEFLAIAAHDLRNPLSEMRQTLLDVVQQLDPDATPEAVSQLRDVKQTVTRMIDTVRAFLDVSRSDRSGMDLDTVDARHLLHRAAERHAKRASVKCITLACTAPLDLDLFATGDAPIIDAILDNLISNALKYSPAESTITLTAERNGNDVCLIVRDQGPGIPDGERAQLFTKHARISTQPTGGEESTGLGLYLAARMAKRIDARIAHVTPPNGGSEFTLCLRASNPL